MARMTPEELAQQARFIFRGTVVRSNAATMASVPVTAQTAVVRVDEVVQAPPALGGYVGREITVQLAGRQKVKDGQQAVFYTNGWLYGESLAVRAVGHLPVPRAQPTLAAASPEPARNLRTRDLKERISTADVIITGKVASVGVPRAEAGGAVALAEESETRGPISEHDPQWREAVIQVEAVEKGSPATQNLVVRFPSSTDVRWFRSPKFEAGQEGVFMLQKTDVPASAFARNAAPGGEVEQDSYTATDPVDVVSKEQLADIRTLIQAAGGSDQRGH